MPRSILVAEDEVLSQRLVSAVIQYCGLEAVIVNNGRECLDQLNSGLQPELILLDLEMPTMSGLQVLEALRPIPPESRCPIVVFTANNQVSTVKEAVALGADDFVVKPFKTGELAQRIKDLTFEIQEEELKEMLHNLHTQDVRLAEAPSLRSRAGSGVDFYPLSRGDKQICVAVPSGQLPQAIARLKFKDITRLVSIYRNCPFGWRKVWPRTAKLASPIAS